MSKKSPLVASALALAVSSAFAQSSTGSNNPLYQLASLDPVVVSAARYEQPLSAVLPSVSVITRDEIEKSQAPTLADLLQGEAGFEFGRNGGPGTVTSFFLRGQDSKGVVLFIDGVRAPVDGASAQTINDFPLNQIDRVEILRGNAGALYGEAAVGGVISIFTKRNTGSPAGYGSVMYGSRNTREIFAGYGGELEDYRFDFNVGSFVTDGFSAMNTKDPKVNPDDDGYKKNYAAFNIAKKIAQNSQIGLRGNVIRAESDYDDGGVWSSDTSSTTHLEKKDIDIFSLYGTYVVTQNWKTNLELSQSETKYRNFKNGVNDESSRYKSTSDAFRWFNNYVLTNSLLSNFGLDFMKDRHTQYGTSGYDVDRDTVAPFFGLSYNRDAISLQANIRLDQIDIDRKDTTTATRISEDKTSGLLGVGYQFAPMVKATAAVSTGFKAPVAYDISTNKDIKSEEYETKEVGLVFSEKNLYARVVYFDTSTTNAIDYDASWNAVNTLKIENKGVEATLNAVWSGTSIRVSAVSQNPKNPATGERRARRAKEYGSLDLSRDVMGYQVGGRIFASGDRLDIPGGSMLGGYGVLSLYASKKIASEWMARLRFENVFDKQYEIAGGYNSVPRGVFLTVQYQPKN